jgi:hypothetical protein
MKKWQLQMNGRNACLRIREEFGYRGHVLYFMTPREHASDEATWADFDFSRIVDGTSD